MKSEAHGNENELQNTHCILGSRDLKGRMYHIMHGKGKGIVQTLNICQIQTNFVQNLSGFD